MLAGVGAALIGIAAALYYASLGLTLAHYDAKAHLVVARRILDSLTPGWEQVGAVWLPLPHLINLLPVQVDALYRTGVFAIAVSIACHAVAAMSIAATIEDLTSSASGAALGATLYATNANTLYLQGTPMTEPMLFGLTTLQVWMFTRWVLRGELRLPRAAGWVMVLACLTRYEAWPVTAACLATSAFAWWRRGQSIRHVLPLYLRLSAYPALAVVGFAAFSRLTVGEWFVSGGFFVPDATLLGQPAAVLEKISDGTELLGGTWLVRYSLLAVAVIATAGIVSPGRSPVLIGASLFAAAALPFSAYLSGHPFRLRYEVPLVVAGAFACGAALGMFRRVAPFVAPLIIATVWWDAPPIDRQAPMILEAQLDRSGPARAEVTRCLRERYRGGAIMTSMGSLGHYMHEMSADGFAIRDFLHEGNGPLWDSAFTRGPAHLVEWVLVEEVAEGGDAIAQRVRTVPALLESFEKICTGGGVALYHRVR
jgi:hypothetical protein